MKLGLIGYPLGHSFSKSYFEEKFRRERLPGFSYDNYALEHPDLIPMTLRSDVFGFNVTIPYKTTVIQYINDIDPSAWAIGAVNTIVRIGANSWKGYNTDWLGFRDSLKSWFGKKEMPQRALILGTGGAAKAIRFALSTLGVSSLSVSTQGNGDYTYEGLTRELIEEHRLIINATPVGMLPEAERAPTLPYEGLSHDHFLFDVIYNPVNTLFLAHGKHKGVSVKNGLDMLHLQAEHAWDIWKKHGHF